MRSSEARSRIFIFLRLPVALVYRTDPNRWNKLPGRCRIRCVDSLPPPANRKNITRPSHCFGCIFSHARPRPAEGMSGRHRACGPRVLEKNFPLHLSFDERFSVTNTNFISRADLQLLSIDAFATCPSSPPATHRIDLYLDDLRQRGLTRARRIFLNLLLITTTNVAELHRGLARRSRP